ncbi:3-deoxy-D-manno-octulosonic acid transferase [Thiomonas sp.]|jgi:3-deoxy-D-manno-octulosonic-acid transferase|uniref:3-deoxy-D-manno-octulosonic acid transferase n=1 Tax=Thiomonas sp. TaxID=2047785 RepID=UPI002609A9A7|nr:3-deoxy-D-manno-octulosonic acid transferase [Thiomonas sp.]
MTAVSQRRALRLYTLAWWLLAPLAVLRLLWRSRRDAAYRMRLGERFGRYALPTTRARHAPLLWLHAVSLGETRAAAPLLEALRRELPDLRLLLTHTTPTGRAAGGELLRGGDAQVWLPYDLPWAVSRFLDHFRPDVGVLMETELWPNLARACAARGIQLLLANARLSARSAARWARWPALARATCGALAGAAAQTGGDASRLRDLGVRDVVVAGNLKFDRRADAALRAQGRQWREAAGRRVLVLASTREDRGVAEEQLLLDAMPKGLGRRALVVLVPRHLERVAALRLLLDQRGLRHGSRSAGPPDAELDVWIGDSIGEMPAYYAMSDAAFVGASLLPLGGQNLIEACAEACPVVMGPHVFNFAQAVEQGEQAGAVARAADAADVWRHLLGWLDDGAALQRARAGARDFSSSHRGAARAQAHWIAQRLRGAAAREDASSQPAGGPGSGQ